LTLERRLRLSGGLPLPPSLRYGGLSNAVTLEVRSLADTLADVATAMETLTSSTPRISFETPELLWKVLTAKRWQLLKALAGAGPVTIREAARRVGRDVKAVHGDVCALLNAGLLDKTEDGKIVFPYDAIHVDFVVRAA
jgi:predicted transcriptional regulator